LAEDSLRIYESVAEIECGNGVKNSLQGVGLVRRQLFFRVDDNYFSLSTTTTF
jgi:hypothetical protein